MYVVYTRYRSSASSTLIEAVGSILDDRVKTESLGDRYVSQRMWHVFSKEYDRGQQNICRATRAIIKHFSKVLKDEKHSDFLLVLRKFLAQVRYLEVMHNRIEMLVFSKITDYILCKSQELDVDKEQLLADIDLHQISKEADNIVCNFTNNYIKERLSTENDTIMCL